MLLRLHAVSIPVCSWRVHTCMCSSISVLRSGVYLCLKCNLCTQLYVKEEEFFRSEESKNQEYAPGMLKHLTTSDVPKLLRGFDGTFVLLCLLGFDGTYSFVCCRHCNLLKARVAGNRRTRNSNSRERWLGWAVCVCGD